MTVYSAALAIVELGVTCVAIMRASRWRAAFAASEARGQRAADAAPPAFTPQLQRAQKMEALGRLAGGIAHDFNNLLTAITGYSELLAAGMSADDPMIQDVHEIRRAALSAGRLSKQLLALGANQRVHTEVLDLNAIVARTAGMLRRTLGEDVTVTLALGADLPPINADRGQIERIVLNLAVNARDAMPQGGRLIVTTALDGDAVTLTVTDTGCGMSEATQARVFEPFFTTKDTAGTGLGLATVYGIVTQSHGSIELTSAPGAGTSFTISLPASVEPLPAGAPAPAPPRRSDVYASVLVVEDDPGVRCLIESALRRTGHDVVSVAGPREALAAFGGRPDFDLVLTDIVMPEMSGYDLADEIRRTAPRACVVYMSGFTCDVVRQPVSEPFLAKPFTVESLTTIVRQALAVA